MPRAQPFRGHPSRSAWAAAMRAKNPPMPFAEIAAALGCSIQAASSMAQANLRKQRKVQFGLLPAQFAKLEIAAADRDCSVNFLAQRVLQTVLDEEHLLDNLEVET